MNHRRCEKLSIWLMVTVLLGAAMSSGAQESTGRQESDSAGEVRLHLAEALRLQPAIHGSELPADVPAAMSGVARRAGISELTLARVGDSWSSLQQAEEVENEAAPKKRRAGRWLKKHWYVPVLVAGAIGALAASGGDDDSSGEDD